MDKLLACWNKQWTQGSDVDPAKSLTVAAARIAQRRYQDIQGKTQPSEMDIQWKLDLAEKSITTFLSTKPRFSAISNGLLNWKSKMLAQIF